MKCSSSNRQAVSKIEKTHSITFKQAIEATFNKVNETSINNQEAFNVYCRSVIGYTYGRVNFITKPAGAKIFINGVLHPETSDIVMPLRTGQYSYRLELNKKKLCADYVEVVENVIKTVKCEQI